MLKIYNTSGAFVRMLPDTDYKDAVLTKTLKDGDKQFEFTYTGDPRWIHNEFYVETSEDRFVIKEIRPGDRATKYVCKLDLEDLEKSILQTFTAKNKTVTQAATSALSGTGWTVSTTITKKRSVQTIKKTPLEILYKIRDAFMCEISFDTVHKTVTFKTKLGQDRGVYFRSDVNLRSISPVYDSYDYYTRLIPIGADGLEINNGGKNYVENYTYSSKIRTLIWEDTSYTDASELMTDATAKLADMAAPKRSYSVDVVDLARIRDSVLSFDLGDTIKLTDENTGVMEKQRIVKIVIHPDDPTKNTVELSNTVLTWEEQQAQLKAAADAWEDISNPDGSVNGVYVHGVQSGDVVGVEVTTGGSTVKKNLQEAVVIMQTGITSAANAASSASTAAANALTTADGKNTVIYSASQPSTSGRKTNDIWFDTDDGNKMYKFASGAWSAAQFGQNAIAANSITANHIVAGAVTAAKISVNNLAAIKADLGEITAGTIKVNTTLDGHVFQGLLRCTGGSAGADGGIRMFEVWDTTAVQSQFYVSTGGFLFSRKGSIAGWSISANQIYKTTVTGGYEYRAYMESANSSTSVAFATAVRTNNGSSTGSWSYPFYVRYDGKLVTSKISATGGDIAGWTITGSRIEKDNTGDGGYRVGIQNATSGAGAAFYAGCGTAAGGAIIGQSVFYVTQAGKLFCNNAEVAGKVTATSGAIGGWTITSNAIKGTANNLTTGIQAPVDNSTIAFAAGSTNSTNWTSAPFRVTHAGKLYASNAEISGLLTANSGKIWLKADGIYTGTVASPTIQEISYTISGNTLISYSLASGKCSFLRPDGTAVFLSTAGGTVIDGQTLRVGKRIIVGADDPSNYVDINAGNNNQMTASLHSERGTADLRVTSGSTELGATNRSGSLAVNTSGYFGLYDRTKSRWVLYADSDGDLYVPRTTYHSGTTVFTTSPKTRNNIYFCSENTDGTAVPVIGWSSGDNMWVGHYTFANRSNRINLGATIDKLYVYNSSGSTVLLSTAVSDRRLKHDITDLQSAKELIMGLHAKEFRYNGESRNRKHYGFVAQEVRPLISDDSAILAYNPVDIETGEYDPNDESTFEYSMDYTQLIAPLVQLVQEQQREIDNLKAHIGRA